MSSRHAVAQGIDAGFAATMLALQCYAYVVGQVVGGGLSTASAAVMSDSYAPAWSSSAMTGIFVATGSLLALAVAGNAIYGFGIGATIAIRSAAFSDVFGGHNFGAVFGITAVAYPLGGVLVMNAGGIMYDRVGNYWPVYGIAMVAIVAWSIALVVAGRVTTASASASGSFGPGCRCSGRLRRRAPRPTPPPAGSWLRRGSRRLPRCRPARRGPAAAAASIDRHRRSSLAAGRRWHR